MREVEGGVFLNEPNICLIAETLRRLFDESIAKECGAELRGVTVTRKDTGEIVPPGRRKGHNEELHMKPKRSLTSVVLELTAVLLMTALSFVWGKGTARIERGYEAIGGEYLFLLLPVIYYTGKRTVLDWITDLRELTKGRY